jgi:hypothetical protein
VKPLFYGVAGICVPLPSNVSLLQCFELFFSDDFMQRIIVGTNRYANKCLQGALNSGCTFKFTNYVVVQCV